ncbi:MULTISPECIES: hypothetical protein [unclassified Micromonospora]|uniref:hypothetical protein n=1 Tax=unclassified Micromonospora TaxID=2617518 RepID=UPI003A87F3B9
MPAATLGELPAATTDKIAVPGSGQVRALVTVAGTGAVHAGRRSARRALTGIDSMVAVDPYLNETIGHVDVILPRRAPLQMPYYDFLISTIQVRNYTRYSPARAGPAQRG